MATWAQIMERWTYAMLTMQEAAQSWAHLTRRVSTTEATSRDEGQDDDLGECGSRSDRAGR